MVCPLGTVMRGTGRAAQVPTPKPSPRCSSCRRRLGGGTALSKDLLRPLGLRATWEMWGSLGEPCRSWSGSRPCSDWAPSRLGGGA